MRMLSEGEAEEARCACKFCGTAGHESELACAQCSRMLPFCIATGVHIYGLCPRCRVQVGCVLAVA